ncbi:MAG: MATE family efflux transporter [Deltaproteobacteria bacterium]|nr:MATE family efflux transporter [Deltaproteobacteria bacterium]
MPRAGCINGWLNRLDIDSGCVQVIHYYICPVNVDLLHDPIPILIRRLAVPVAVGFFFNTMFNVVDTWYAGWLSTEGIAALTLSFPIFFTIVAVGNGVSTAATAIVSHELGKADERAAAHLFAQSLVFALILSIALAVVGVVVANRLLLLMSDDAQAVALGLDYLVVIFIGVPFFILQSVFNASLTARGDTRSFRNVLIGGFLLNLALDPLFLFGVTPLGIHGMGVAGIALATVLIQAGGMVYLAWCAWKRNVFLLLGRHDWIPRATAFSAIARQALPAGLSMMFVAVGILIINTYVADAGNTAAVAAYGIAMRIEQIALLPTIGLSVAVLAIVGQNAGAGNWIRVRQTYFTALRYGAIVMATMLCGIIPFAAQWISLFDATPEVVSVGKGYLYVEVITFYAYVLVFLTTSLLQGLKKPMFAVWIGLYRQGVAPLVVFYLLLHVFDFGVTGIWWGICGITWSAAVVAVVFAIRTLGILHEIRIKPIEHTSP